MLVDPLPVEGAVAVVVWLGVVRNRRNPDGVEAHALDVVQLGLDACESTTAVL